jgi:2-dehydro-3-deoxyphosphogluconate aldolase / (4S)-4-hydroxy-2-oxoglutarate aldolase
VTRTTEIQSAILAERFVAIIRAPGPEQAKTTVEALIASGVRVLELSLTTPKALPIIEATASTLPDGVVLGAGTVTTAAEARAAISAGASFLVAPTAAGPAFEVAHSNDVLFIPGAFTPTEIYAARASGASLIKLFPATPGGSEYVRDLLGPLPDLLLMPTGGVTIENAADFLANGAVAVGVGGALTRGGEDSVRAAAMRLMANLRDATGAGHPKRS